MPIYGPSCFLQLYQKIKAQESKVKFEDLTFKNLKFECFLKISKSTMKMYNYIYIYI